MSPSIYISNINCSFGFGFCLVAFPYDSIKKISTDFSGLIMLWKGKFNVRMNYFGVLCLEKSPFNTLAFNLRCNIKWHPREILNEPIDVNIWYQALKIDKRNYLELLRVDLGISSLKWPKNLNKTILIPLSETENRRVWCEEQLFPNWLKKGEWALALDSRWWCKFWNETGCNSHVTDWNECYIDVCILNSWRALHVKNPTLMELIFLQGKSNFSKKGFGKYQKVWKRSENLKKL